MQRRESTDGGYVAWEESAPDLAAGWEALCSLVGPAPAGGWTGAWTTGATAGTAALLAAWPLRPGDRLGVLPAAYGSDRMAALAVAARAGAEVVDLPVDALGRLDVDGLAAALDRGLTAVLLAPVASQRGVLQPAAEVGRRCRAAGVPLLVDAAQSLAQVEGRDVDADAWVVTGRKWLCGPRGTGAVLLAPALAERLRPPLPALGSAEWADGDPWGSRPAPGGQRFAADEATVAAQVGLATALLDAAGPDADPPAAVAARARRAREVLDGAGGWAVVEAADEPTGIMTLRPPPGADPPATRVRLLTEHRVLVSAVPVRRAPADLPAGPVLRVSCGPWVDDDDLARCRAALAAEGRSDPRVSG